MFEVVVTGPVSIVVDPNVEVRRADGVACNFFQRLGRGECRLERDEDPGSQEQVADSARFSLKC